MRLHFAGQRVLAVMAHPDDLELLCAGTLARACQDGAAVAVCVVCRGDRGGSPPGIAGPDQLAAVRRQEAEAALRLLSAEAELFWLDVPDSQAADTHSLRQKLLGVLRRFRPRLVVTHDVNDYHADHRATAQLAQAASWMAASPGQQDGQEPLPCPPELWLADTVLGLDFQPHFYIDITDHLELKRRMLQCHRSQLARAEEAGFSDLDHLLVQQARWRGAQSGVPAAEAFRTLPRWKRLAAW